MNTDRSNHPTVIEYAIQHLFKRKTPAAAAKETVAKLSGSENLFLGPGIVTIDPKKLEEAIWGRMVQFTIQGLKHFKKGKEHWAISATLNHYKQPPKFRAELKKRIVQELGQDPFPYDDGS